ncbi:BTAD domain-containing putative transcriptional regulator [Amycolatopsis sp. NPDC059657]|uniref:AfsR/SARP family transcriptional regulator n=1 Tax=Amycolatopsis sp. NPDC059657 TaxID=3346899 RepID=UPI003672E23A
MKQRLEFSLLGQIRAARGAVELDLGSPQQRMTLAALLVGRGRLVTVDEIVTVLWGETVPRTARGTLRTYVHRLRRVLETDGGDQVVGSVGGGYVLRAPEESLDLTRFDLAVREAESSRDRGDLEVAAAAFRAALAEWRGEALADLTGEWADLERARLGQRRIAVLEELAAVELRLGRPANVIELLSETTRDEPLRERAHELLILALYQSGRQADALGAYEKMRRLLRDELGVDPGSPLRELHQRILRADPALVPSAPETFATKPAQLPVNLPVFVGRRAEHDVMTAIPRSGAAPAVVVHGMAGVGKTAFALRWAHEVADQFPDGQLYVNLRGFEEDGSAVEPVDALRGFLAALGVPTPHIPDRLDALTALYRSVLADRRCLIVLDNARDGRQVLPLLPASARSFVVITSRAALPGLVAATGSQTVALDLLSAHEATELLAGRLGAARVAAEPDAVRAIIASCARLPLALALVCARASYNPGFSLAAVAAELEEARGDLDVFGVTDGATDIRSVLSWSYRALLAPAARLFRLLSIHPGGDIDANAAAALTGLPPMRTLALLRELAAAHLVAERVPGRFGWHDLLRSYATELARADDGAAALHRLLDYYRHTAHNAAQFFGAKQDTMGLAEAVDGVEPRSFASYEAAFDWFAAEHTALVALITRAADAGFAAHVTGLTWSIRHFLDWGGHWRDLTAVNEIALAVATRADDKVAMAYAYRGLARVAGMHGEYGQAQKYLELALDHFGEAGEELAKAYAHRQLSGLMRMAHDFTGALAEAAEALKVFREAGAEVGEGMALTALAANLARLGRHEEAVEPGLRSLAIIEANALPYDLADLLDFLGRVHHQLGRFDEAAAYWLRALGLFRCMEREVDPAWSLVRRDRMNALAHLSMTLHAAGREGEARQALRDSLTILVDQLRSNYYTVGRYAEAGATLVDSVASLDKVLADETEDWYDRAMAVLREVSVSLNAAGLGVLLDL